MLKKYLTYISKHNLNHESKIIILMIRNGEGWHYLAVKNLSALLRGITSKNYSNFYCVNCLRSFKVKNKLKSLKKICENKDFCNVVMPSKDTKILDFNLYRESDKAPFIIYVDLETLIEKIVECKSNP